MTDHREDIHDEPPAPSPDASGSEGDQASPPTGSTSIVPLQPVQLDDSHVGATLNDFGTSRSPGVQAITVALYRSAQQTLSEVMERWSRAEDDKGELRARIADEQRTVAILRERLRLAPRMTRVQTLGGILFGAGLGIAYSERTLLGIGGALVLIGALLYVLGRPVSADIDE